MAQFRMMNPYDPQYRLPGYVMAEPPGRGALVTDYITRRFIDSPATSSAGYAVPGYVMSEQVGRGARGTYWLPRRHVDRKAPDALAPFKFRSGKRPKAVGSLAGGIFDRHVFSRKG